MDDPTQTDAERTAGARFALLWEEPQPARRGRPPKVTRAEVVDAAVALADERGLDAVSMRSVARTLGVGTMTLYSYVPGRDELVDAMIDRAHADMELPRPDMEWRLALETYGRGSWGVLRAHPWLLGVNSWRMPLGPHVLAMEEAGLRSLVDTGLSAQQVIETLRVLDNAVSGSARAASTEAAEESAQGKDYEAFWADTMDFWATTFDPARFPTMTRLWASGAFDEAATPFELRLGGLLDTIELLIEHARAEGGEPIPTFEDCMTRLAGRAEGP